MKRFILVLTACSALAVAGCTTNQGVLAGGATGAAAGALATRSVGGAIFGAGVGALAGAVLVNSSNNMCTYRYHDRLYRERCR
jgi:surface antigen